MIQTDEGAHCMNSVFPFSVTQVMANAQTLAVGFILIIISVSL